MEAYSDHLSENLNTIAELKSHMKLEKHFLRQRESFFHAECLRSYARDSVPPGTFESLLDEFKDGVIDILDDDDTQRGLKSEAVDLRFKTDNQKEDLQKIQDEINTVVSDVIQPARSTYAEVVEFHSQLRSGRNLLQKISELEFQKQQQEEKTGSGSEPDKPVSDISKSTLSDFSKVYKNILKQWHFPDHEEVYFDEKSKDFVINGKPRGSRGKGLRAITHAAFTIALLEYCQKKKLPHPGFVVLDSPLLAYWKPEGDDDKELQGTDLEERFYEYLIEKHADNQIIIMENKHPADDLMKKMKVTIFTKNEAQGRYGLFPPVENII